ncbi:MAG: transglycosylase SLT domain-containing protein [Bacteroidaceae bacterium]|nr:transglycosylase SLT domain-containing protein [Bacteroidaceae bacterium]
MDKKVIIASLSALFTTFCNAQEVVNGDEVGKAVEVDMPEGMLISEDELMNDYTNKTNLSEGTGVSRVLSYNDSVIVNRLSRIPTTIEMPLNDVTRKFIEQYSNRMGGSVSVMLGASNFYNPIFEEALEKYGLPLELKYLPVIESGLRPSATSRVGAAGLWQFMIATGKRYGLEINTLVDERRDPIKSSEAAAHYLSDLYGMFGDWSLAIAAYNCGEGNVQKAIIRSGNQEKPDFWTVYGRLPKETRGYVPAFIAATYIMNYYCDHGITPRDATLPLESDTVIVRNEVSFAQIASKCNVSVDELRAINPQYRKDIVPASYTLRLPASAVEDFVAKEDSIYGSTASSAFTVASTRRAVTDDVEAYSAPAVRNSRAASNRNSRKGRSSSTASRSSASKNVSVKSGDTLSGIAKRNGTTVANIRRLNGIKGDMIRPGQSIRVK